MKTESWDLIVIGGGSGGIATANRAAKHGARVALIEKARLGGTCVNAGCVPKKVMWNAGQISKSLSMGSAYGFEIPSHHWNYQLFAQRRAQYVERLNAIYSQNLTKNGVTVIRGEARFMANDTVSVAGRTLQAPHRLIAVGGKPSRPASIEGVNLGLSSDEMFALTSLPKKIAIIGAGYIAVEFAGALHDLGCDVSLFARKDRLLNHFDHEIGNHLQHEMEHHGITIHRSCEISAIRPAPQNTFLLESRSPGSSSFAGFDLVLLAVGREPALESLQLSLAGISPNGTGHIPVDEWQNTVVPGTYAIGDVIGKAELTPVAIAAGRRLADRLFHGQDQAKLSYDLIPSVVFSHPPVGTLGLSETEAIAKYGQDQIKIYRSTFSNMLYSLQPEPRPKTFLKLVTQGPNEKIVGMHGVGDGMDEMLQGFAVAIKMGACKADFDRTIAIHPTAAEEWVLMT
jgi:glutathione reductase (NADPH)